jgi:3-(3-hydroxy-phenyl)propionate hydroxylase
MLDVLIAGCGPVGATLGNLLAREGLSVEIVERAALVYPKPRAITLDHEGLRIFQWCGVGDAIDALSAPHPGTDYVGADGRLIKRFDPEPPPYPLGWRPNVVFLQPEMETTLRAALGPPARVRLRTATEMTAFTQDADGVRATLRGPDGDVSTVAARWLVACDGAGSPTRKALDIAVEDLDFDEWWIVLDAFVDPDIDVPPKARQYCRPSRPGTFIPGPRDVRRWEIKILPGEDPRTFEDEANVRAVLATFVDVSKLRIWRSAVYRFHALVAREWRRGRVLLAGDAVHQTPPFMGQGLCAGLRDAGNLFWKLAAVIRDGAPATLLDTYAVERRPHVREVIARTKTLGLVIGELDPERARARDDRMADELASGRAEVIRQRFIPGLADGLVARTADGGLAPGAGELFVQPTVVDAQGRGTRLDDRLGARFAVVTIDPMLPEALAPASLALLDAIGGRIAVIGTYAASAGSGALPEGVLVETATLFRDWCTAHGCTAVVVRPDRYVFGVASSADAVDALLASVGAALR